MGEEKASTVVARRSAGKVVGKRKSERQQSDIGMSRKNKTTTTRKWRVKSYLLETEQARVIGRDMRRGEGFAR